MLKGPSKWTVSLLDSCRYRVEGNQTATSYPNMLSLAFSLTPIPVRLMDDTGLTQENPPPAINETELALGILRQVECLQDLDQVVDGDQGLFEGLVQESTALLKAARYSVESYPGWAEEKRIRFGRAS